MPLQGVDTSLHESLETFLETMMNTRLDTAAQRESIAGGTVATLLAAIKRALAAYLVWRAEGAAIARLNAMTDRELRDVGVTRSQIPFAVRRGRPGGRTIRPYL